MAIRKEDIYEMMPVRVLRQTYGIDLHEQVRVGQGIGSTCYLKASSLTRITPHGDPEPTDVIQLYINHPSGHALPKTGWFFRLSDLDYVFAYQDEDELAKAWSID